VGENSLLPIALHPNPASGNVSIEAPVQNGTILLIDQSGRIVYSNTFENGKHEIKLNSFAKGLYRVVLESGQLKSQKSLIINQ
jgi:hypothetical protein